MIKNMIKIALAAVVLGAASPVYALQFGEYAVMPFNEEQQSEAFNICIQPDRSWYISGPESGWKGKWAEFKSVSDKAYPGIPSDGKNKVYILQAIHPDEGSMRSVAINASEYSISGNYLNVSASSGLGSGFEAELTYKGSRCAPYQAGTVQQTQKSIANGSEESHLISSVGQWQIKTFYKKGQFEVCAAGIASDSGWIGVGSADNKHWQMRMSPVTELEGGSKRGSTFQFNSQIGNLSPVTHSASIDPDDGSIVVDVDIPWVSDFFNYSEGMPEGTVRDYYRAWPGVGELFWKLDGAYDAFGALSDCIEKYKPAARTVSRHAPFQTQYAPRAPRNQPRPSQPADVWNQTYNPPATFRVTTGVNYRSCAGKNCSKLGTVRKGSLVTVTRMVKGWYEITLQPGRYKYGYIYKKYLTRAAGNAGSTQWSPPASNRAAPRSASRQAGQQGQPQNDVDKMLDAGSKFLDSVDSLFN